MDRVASANKMKLKSQRHRSSSSIDCPHCGRTIRYYAFSGMSDVAPHFYCDSCSNVFWSEPLRKLLYEREADAGLLSEIEGTLPDCPCGGRFSPGCNPKCPHCGKEIAHQSDPVARLTDPYAIIVKGAAFVTREDEPPIEHG